MSTFTEGAGSTAERLEVSGIVPGAAPADVLRAFTTPQGLVAWWSEEADVDPRPGGRLVASWPSRSLAMRGTFTEIDEHGLGFTWSWDHEPEAAATSVHVVVEPVNGGTRLIVTHGEYAPDDASARVEHLEGWLFFLPRLAAALGRA